MNGTKKKEPHVALLPDQNNALTLPRVLLNALLFQLGWFACIVAVAHHEVLWGIVAVGLVILAHLMFARRYREELKLVVAVSMVGVAVDAFFQGIGALTYPIGLMQTGVAPLWIVALWALLATGLNVSMRWMKGHFIWTATFGAIGGPLSYAAAERWGVVIYLDPLLAWISLSAGWALAMPIAVLLSEKWNGFKIFERGNV